MTYQGIKRLFVFAYDNAAGDVWVSVNSYEKYLLPRVKIENYINEIQWIQRSINRTRWWQQVVYSILYILKKIAD